MRYALSAAVYKVSKRLSAGSVETGQDAVIEKLGIRGLEEIRRLNQLIGSKLRKCLEDPAWMFRFRDEAVCRWLGHNILQKPSIL